MLQSYYKLMEFGSTKLLQINGVWLAILRYQFVTNVVWLTILQYKSITNGVWLAILRYQFVTNVMWLTILQYKSIINLCGWQYYACPQVNISMRLATNEVFYPGYFV